MKWTDRHKRNVFGITWADKGQTAITYSLDKQVWIFCLFMGSSYLKKYYRS